MKLEPRGKYPGVKVHLEAEECEGLLEGKGPDPTMAMTFIVQLRKKIRKLLEEEPGLLKPRSEDQIQAELKEEAAKATMKLAKAGAGAGEWNDANDPTFKVVVFPSGKLQTFQRKAFAEWTDWGQFLKEAAIPPGLINVRAIK